MNLHLTRENTKETSSKVLGALKLDPLTSRGAYQWNPSLVFESFVNQLLDAMIGKKAINRSGRLSLLRLVNNDFTSRAFPSLCYRIGMLVKEAGVQDQDWEILVIALTVDILQVLQEITADRIFSITWLQTGLTLADVENFYLSESANSFSRRFAVRAVKNITALIRREDCKCRRASRQESSV